MVVSTDKVMGDTNNSVPRVIARGSVDLTTYSAYGSLYRATATVVLNNILATDNPIIECYFYASGGGTNTLNKMNYNVSNSTQDPSLNANFYLTSTTYNGRSVVQINFEHVRNNQNIRSIYYVVYSSAFTTDSGVL